MWRLRYDLLDFLLTLYYAVFNPLLFYILPWGFYVPTVWFLDCSYHRLVTPTHTNRIFVVGSVVCYSLGMLLSFMHHSKHVRYYFHSLHTVVTWLLRLCIIGAGIIFLLFYTPSVLFVVYLILVFMCCFQEWYDPTTKVWSNRLYYLLQGTVDLCGSYTLKNFHHPLQQIILFAPLFLPLRIRVVFQLIVVFKLILDKIDFLTPHS